MNYQECLNYLEQASRFGIKLGLENIRLLLQELGSPQNSFPSILVAGTNGKGSVCAMIHSALHKHGLKVGLYTSPHLVRVEERIRINHEPISASDFCQILSYLRGKVDELLSSGRLTFPPTYFELLTALAFLYFSREKVDLAVLEVGLGGRLDATNVVTPLVSVITTISRDHTEHLGPTIRKIAAEKAGIIKPGVPVVCGENRPQALEVVTSRAKEAGSPLIRVFGRGKFFEISGHSTSSYLYYHNGEKFLFRPGLPGKHQGRNAAIAIAALSVLKNKWPSLIREKIIEGIEEVVWEGRLEKIGEGPEVYIDGAHNEEGAGAIRLFLERKAPGKIILVFGILKDKAIRRVARQLFPLARKVFITSIPSPRAAKPEEIFRLTHDLNGQIVIEPDCLQALRLAQEEAGQHGLVLVTGSLYLVGEIKKRLRENEII
jgi:dihydrofolate synthase/folylpolyglutamate synthase